MAKKPLTDAQILESSTALQEIGRVDSIIARNKTPENLTDVLMEQLLPNVRRKLARRLIEIALHSESERNAMEAIREIMDRVEGKTRQTVMQARSKTDPVLKLYLEVFGEDKRLLPVRERMANDAEFRILDDESEESADETV